VFDIITKGSRSLLHPCDLTYAFAYGHGNGTDDDLMDVAAMAAAVLSWQFHGSFLVRQQVNWQMHTRLLLHEKEFKKFYRMSLSSFNILLEILHPHIKINLKQSSNASKGRHPIIHEIILHCTLRYLAGGSYHNIRTTAGLSRSSFYCCIYHGIEAINCPQLKMKFPFTLLELHQTAAAFESHSTHGICNGCIGALDGWLCQVQVPSANEAKKVKEYFSGHYQCYGLNIQATCDASCSFTPLSVLCPGGTSDSKAFYSSRTYNLVEQLPEGFYVLADNAYCLSSTLLIPYSGWEKQDKSKDAFNFFLSLLRI
jgi:hypothetical protein